MDILRVSHALLRKPVSVYGSETLISSVTR